MISFLELTGDLGRIDAGCDYLEGSKEAERGEVIDRYTEALPLYQSC